MASSTKRKEKTFSPLNSSDKPDNILTKLKSISDFTSDVNISSETLNKESLKQMLTLLENLTQKFLVDSVDDHPQLKLMLSCCLIDLVRILGPHNTQIQNKSQFIVSMVNETLLSSDKLTDSHYLTQLHYLLQQFDRSQGYLLLGIEKLWELSRDFVSACFDVVDALQNQPEIYSRVQQILGNVLENIRNTAKEDITEEIVLPLLMTFEKSNKKTKKMELAKAALKEMSWNLRQLCGKVCMDIFRRRGIYRSINPSLSIERVCYMIQVLFKIDYEIILAIWPYLENEINMSTKKEVRKAYLVLLGKICSSKLSHVSTTCPQIFNNFVETLTSKKNKPFRHDLLQLAFKYIKNFTYCKTVSDHEIQTSTVKYNVYKNNLSKLEAKIKEILYETDDENKAYILERIKTLSLENPKFISQDLLRDVSTLLWYEKERKKENILDLLSDLYIQYCCTLFDEDIYDFDSLTGNYEFINGFLDGRVRQRKEVGKNFLWIAEQLILFFHHNTTKAFGLLQTTLNKVLGLHTLQNKGVVKRLLGFYYNLWMKKYDKEATKEDIADQKSIRYRDFIQKKLKYNWFSEKEILNPDFFFLMRGISKIFKLSNQLHQNFADYLRALREDNPVKAEECRNFILTYYTFNTNFDQIEKEITNAFERDDFQDDVKALIDSDQSFSSKQELAASLSRSFDSKGTKFFFENLGINLFNEHITERLISLVSSIIQRDKENRVFIQEGSLNLLIYLTKRNFHSKFKRDLAEIASYLSENIEIVILKAKRADPTKAEELYESQSTNSYVVSCLELLSLLNLNDISDPSHNVDLEGLKYYLSDRLTKLELPSRQAKYAARVVHNLDTVTSETIGAKIIEKMLPHLEIKSPSLLSTLRTLQELLRKNKDIFLYHVNDLNKFLYDLVSEPVALPREHLISELSQCKRVLIKTLYNSYFNNDDNDIGNANFKKSAADFKIFLLQLLLNFNDVCAGFMLSDKDYLRIFVLDYYLEILAKESSIDLDAESFAKLSLLCYDDNDDIKKYLFSCVFYKRTRRHNPLNYIYFLYSFFLCFAEDHNLRVLAEDTLTKEIDSISKNYVTYLEKIQTEDVTRSPEYMVIYVIFLMCNNPLLLLGVKVLSYHFYKCLDHFVSILGKTKNPHKEEYLMEILHTLRNFNPVVFEECASTRMEFTDIKKRKVVKKGLKKGESKESQSQTVLTFQEIVDVIISHFKTDFKNPNLQRGRVQVPIPRKFFRPIGQEPSGKAEKEVKSGQRVSEAKQHTEVKAPRELTPPMSAQSVNLVKKLDFSGEDIESSEALRYIGSGQKRKSGEMRKPTPTKMEVEEEKTERSKRGTSDKKQEESMKDDIENVEVLEIQYEKEAKGTRGRKAKGKGKQEKGKASASVSTAKESKQQSEAQSAKQSSQRSKSEKPQKGKTEKAEKTDKKESAPPAPSVRETRSRATQETQKEVVKNEKSTKKQESKKGKESKKEPEEEENTRMTRSRGQKTKRKDEDVPKGKKVKMSK